MDVYTIQEVETHNKEGTSIWIVIDNTVYDVSSYIERDLHPGGNEVLYKYAGTDATKRFAEIHSKSAWNELEQFKIGRLNENLSFFRRMYDVISKLY
jgi:L-lactate dehydrogenase (cytochrome)